MYLRRASTQRHFAAVAKRATDAGAPPQTAGAPVFNQVKFVSEPVEQVAKEVPQFQFYEMPEAVHTNVYRNHLMSLPVPEYKNYMGELGAKPKVEYSQLENGLKVVSVDKGESDAAIGLYVNAGSRFEKIDMQGLSHMTAMAAYKSTAHLSYLRIAKTMETLGVKADAVAGRETIAYRTLLNREHMPIVAPLLVGNILYPRLLQWEINPLHTKIDQYQNTMSAEDRVSELMHAAAFLNNTLGWNVQAKDKHVTHFTGEVIREYMMEHFSPDRMVIVGVNVDHGELSKWSMRSFVDYNTIPSQTKNAEAPKYYGGDSRQSSDSSTSVNVSIGFNFEGGWSSPDLFAMNVYQAALGGSSSGFTNEMSATGSKLAPLVGKNGVGSCLGFSNVYSDAGLCGVSATMAAASVPAYIQEVGSVLAGSGNVTAEELKRAKNLLKTNINLSLDSPEKLMEDMGRQMILSGKVLSPSEMAAKIDAVTAADVQKVAQKVLSSKPTVVSYGAIEYVPHYDEICATLTSPKSSIAAAAKKA